MGGLVGMCFGHGEASQVHRGNTPNMSAGAIRICLR